MAQVNITVNGRIYRMACEDGEEDHVTELGQRFDEAINELRAVLGEIGDQRLMVMAGILMTDRLGDGYSHETMKQGSRSRISSLGVILLALPGLPGASAS